MGLKREGIFRYLSVRRNSQTVDTSVAQITPQNRYLDPVLPLTTTYYFNRLTPMRSIGRRILRYCCCCCSDASVPRDGSHLPPRPTAPQDARHVSHKRRLQTSSSKKSMLSPHERSKHLATLIQTHLRGFLGRKAARKLK